MAKIERDPKTWHRHAKGILGWISFSTYAGQHIDRALSQVAADAAGGDAKAFKTTKKLFTDDELKEWNEACRQCKVIWNAFSVPSDDLADGSRFFWGRKVQLQQQAMAPRIAAMDAARQNIIKAYPRIYADGARRLGSAWNPDKYPSPAEIGDHFGWNIKYRPAPDPEALKWADLSTEEQEALTNELQAGFAKQQESAKNDLRCRLRAVATRLADRVGALVSHQKGEAKTKFHDTVITSVQEIIPIIRDLTDGEDVELNDVLNTLEEKVAVFTPQALKQDPALAEAVLATAKDVADKTAQWGI